MILIALRVAKPCPGIVFSLALTLLPTLTYGGEYESGSETCSEKHAGISHTLGPEFARRAFDDVTGRSPRQYPPDRFVDLLHLKLEAKVDIDRFSLSARETLTFMPIGLPITSLTLDGVNLDITSLTDINGSALDQYYDGRRLTILFPKPIDPGTESGVMITYECVKPPTGLHYAANDASHPNRLPMIHSQGETEDNRFWFFTHDSPNERLTSELVMTAPKPYGVISNGRLVRVQDAPGDAATYHWLQDKPHVSYLITLCIGQWDTVTEAWRGKPVTYHVPKGRGDDAGPSYGSTPEMLEFFSNLLDEEYPWDRYAQVVVENFSFGGMENTSATTMWEGCILDGTARAEGDIEGIVSHELGHQWFGDLMTCESWDHIWLNEGFATYSSHLWFEHSRGKEDYWLGIRDTMNGVAGSDKSGKGMAPMVFNDFSLGQDAFFRPGANPYSKGCSVLAMLRAELGDDLFFKGIAQYIDQCRFSVVETDDLRQAFEDVAGRDLRWFFDQWVYRAGTPELAIDAQFDPVARRLKLRIDQTQPVSRDEPAFRLTLPVWIRTATDERVIRLDIRDRSYILSEPLPSAPVAVVIDPWSGVLATRNLTMPQSWWVAQLEHGPTLVSRIEAMNHLAESADTVSVAGITYEEYLRKIVYSPESHRRLRTEGASCLSRRKSSSARRHLTELLDQGMADSRVRAALISSLASYEDPNDLPRFASLAAAETSYVCKSAAISALARFRTVEHFDLIAAAAMTPDQPAGPMGSAIDAMAALGDDRSLSELLRISDYDNGFPFRIRAQAIRAIPRCLLADAPADRRANVVDFLIGLLHDPERRAFEAAFDALVDIGDPRAIEPIRAVERTTLVPRFRHIANWAAETLKTRNDRAGG